MRAKGFRVSLSAIIFFTSLAVVFSLKAGEPADKLPLLLIFHSPSCHRCLQAKNELIPKIERKFQGKIRVEYRDISAIENYKELLALEKKYNSGIKNVMPVFYINGHFLNGDGRLEMPLEAMIHQALALPFEEGGKLPEIDLTRYFQNFKFIFILGAGLIDGINPCAFTVLVFFVSFLALQGYKKKELVVVGSAFISALFITYSLIGLGLFASLYQLKGFWLASKAVNFSIGVLSIVLAILSLYDFLRFKETKSTAGLVLQLPESIKNRIHHIVGLHYRIDKNIPENTRRKNIPKLVASAFITGFLITILEAVCTGQTYLPTLSFILTASSAKLQAFFYILTYNLMFILPLIAIFIFALLGTSSGQFSAFLKRNMLAVKLAMALLFFSLGIYLIWRT